MSQFVRILVYNGYKAIMYIMHSTYKTGRDYFLIYMLCFHACHDINYFLIYKF
jgi:hypothetical protein